MVSVVLLVAELARYLNVPVPLPLLVDHTAISTAIATLVTGITAVFGVAVAIIAGFYAKEQLLAGQKVAYGDFLLRLDEAFWRHREVHKKLRPGGDWSLVSPEDEIREKVNGPHFLKDGADIEGYMGLFERVQLLREKDLIDIETVNRLYGYRLFTIVKNDNIYQGKLVENGDGWTDFIRLWRDLSALEGNKGQKKPDSSVLKHLERKKG